MVHTFLVHKSAFNVLEMSSWHFVTLCFSQKLEYILSSLNFYSVLVWCMLSYEEYLDFIYLPFFQVPPRKGAGYLDRVKCYEPATMRYLVAIPTVNKDEVSDCYSCC